MTRIVGVVPAAGRAKRLQPLAGSKEMLGVGGRPVIDYVVERLRATSADEIRVVTRSEKRDVAEHAELLGLTVVRANPETLAQSVLAGIQGLAEDDAVLLGFPDSLWEPVDGFCRLLEGLDADTAVVLGLFRSGEPKRGDVVELGPGRRVARVHVKPADPLSDLIWGMAAGRAGALTGLRDHDQPGNLFDEVARRGRARAVLFPGEFIDIGIKEALERARQLLGQ